RAARSLAEHRRDGGVVRYQIEAFANLREFDCFRELTGLDWHRVGDVSEAVRGEGSRFGERRDGYSRGAARCLYARHLDALVRLDVRAQGSAEAAHALRHPLGVALQAFDIEH